MIFVVLGIWLVVCVGIPYGTMRFMSRKEPNPKDVDLEEIYTEIVEGYRSPLVAMSRLSRAVQRWQRANPDTALHLRHKAAIRRGVPPVAFEDELGPVTRKGWRPSRKIGRTLGYFRSVTPPREYLMASNFAAGWNPNVVGSPAPMIGPPVGQSMNDGRDIGFDVFSWHQQGLISTPSAFVFSTPGKGKSTSMRVFLEGHIIQGHGVIIPSDSKNEYSKMTEMFGGQVIRIGHGLGHLNPLDPGALGSIIPELRAAMTEENKEMMSAFILRAQKETHAAQRRMVETLISIGRKSPLQDFESAAIATALEDLYAHDQAWVTPPTISDLIDRLAEGSEALYHTVVVTGAEEYHQLMSPLLRSLYALLNGVTGEIFAGQTTTPINVDAPVICIDMSVFDDGDTDVKAAVIMSCWSAALGAATAAKLLADAGLREQKVFVLSLDELWAVLAAAPAMTLHVDAMLRLLRTLGMVVYLITHGSKDLEALPTEEDRNRAMGFIERAGVVLCGGVPASELDLLESRLPFNQAERAEIISWNESGALQRERGKARRLAPGVGRFMLKASKSSAAGIPFRTILTPTEGEFGIHDTDGAFRDAWAKVEQKAESHAGQ